jgi:hypothetical protein
MKDRKKNVRNIDIVFATALVSLIFVLTDFIMKTLTLFNIISTDTYYISASVLLVIYVAILSFIVLRYDIFSI